MDILIEIQKPFHFILSIKNKGFLNCFLVG